MAGVATGLDVIQEEGFESLRLQRLGLVTHAAAVDSNYQSALDVLLRADQIRLMTLFAPEHGYFGNAQDLIPVPDNGGGLNFRSLYGSHIETLWPTPRDLAALDGLVIDLVDIGARYYTFQATMLHCLEAAGDIGMPVTVLDRPNPLGGTGIEGPLVRRGFESFVGCHAIPIRHGMTMGELATMYVAERNLKCLLTVVRCEGWTRAMTAEQTGLPWIMPSPNMPTLETVHVYPGQCLLEGTNISEGRGTTRPFEIVGAPWLNPDRLAAAMNHVQLPGVHFRALRFRPTFQKFAGQDCGGIQLHVYDPALFRSALTALVMLYVIRQESGDAFAWRTEPYEFVDHIPAIDLLFGSSRERQMLEDRAPLSDIFQDWLPQQDEFRLRREPYLLYQ